MASTTLPGTLGSFIRSAYVGVHRVASDLAIAPPCSVEITRGDADQAALIGRLHACADGEWLAEQRMLDGRGRRTCAVAASVAKDTDQASDDSEWARERYS